MQLIKEKSYGQKLVKNTCLFCGAPKIPITKICNYCNCYYIKEKDFIVFNENLEFDVISLDLRYSMFTNDLAYNGMIISQPRHIGYEISFSIKNNPKNYMLIKDWFSSREQKDLVLYYNYDLKAIKTHITSMSINYESNISIIEIKCVPDKVEIKEGY